MHLHHPSLLNLKNKTIADNFYTFYKDSLPNFSIGATFVFPLKSPNVIIMYRQNVLS